MDWDTVMKIVEVVIIPITAFLIREIQNCRKELGELKISTTNELMTFKVYTSQNYAGLSAQMRLEDKIDNLRDMLDDLRSDLSIRG